MPERTGPTTRVLTHLRVNNLRALRMDSAVELRRLTLIVGRNGVGKSTLARVFPLLGQSVRRGKREPVLWFSEEGPVDFGSFDRALRRGAEEMDLGFRWTGWVDGPAQERDELTCTLVRGEDGSRTSRIRWEDGTGAWAEFRFGPEGQVTFDGQLDADTRYPADGNLHELCQGLAPSPATLFGNLADAIWEKRGGTEEDGRPTPQILLVARMSQSGWRSRQDLLDAMRRAPWFRGTRQTELAQHGAPLASDSQSVQLFELMVFHRIFTIEYQLDSLLDNTAYIGPFRRAPQRDYRVQSLAVEQIDPRGNNLVMFIHALTEAERTSLNEFLSEHLDFSVHLRPDGERFQLLIQLGEAIYNVSDVGFGFSQVLPVAVQLWAAGRVLSHSRELSPLQVLVVEQPELHLHPNAQALVARALAACASTEEGPIQLVETHSDHIVQEIGLLIAERKLAADRVSVLCVEPHPDGAGAQVRAATYDDEGVLHNWPIGFMSP